MSEPHAKKQRLSAGRVSEPTPLTGQQEADPSARLATTPLEYPSVNATEASPSATTGTGAMSARDPVKIY